MSTPRWFLGLSCGSSGEGIDVALVETSGVGLGLQGKLVHSLRRPFTRELQDLLIQTLWTGGESPPQGMQVLHRLLGDSFVAATNQLLTQNRFPSDRILAIGVLAPFIWHEPSGRNPSTREIGKTSILADRTGITVVHDFREQDVASGGQGMPQTALADSLLFRHPTEDRLLIHLGSTTSVVYLKQNSRVQDVIAFEAGPGTSLLDAAIRQGTSGRERFDPGGKYAVQGRCLDSLVEKWLDHSFIQLKPPKSLPRSAFRQHFLNRAVQSIAEIGGTLQDLLCSLSHFVIRCLIGSCQRWLPEGMNSRAAWLSGGGTRNGMLWRILEQYAPEWKWSRLDDFGISTQMRNATGAAMLATLTLDGVPASTPSATGAVGRMLGRITPGGPSNWSRCLRWMVQHSVEPISPYRAA
jgi:anhydro-N-acetylmuramic acid kinase